MTEIDPKLSRLYREASTEAPPAAVDAAILAAAHLQVAQSQRDEGLRDRESSQRQQRSLWSRWMVPAGAMATLVLAVSIAFLVEREQPGSVDRATDRPVPQRPQSWPPAPVTESLKPEAADSAPAGAAVKKEAPAAAAPAQGADVTTPAQTPAATYPAPAQAPEPAAPAASAAEAFPAERRAKEAAPVTAAPKTATESNSAGDSAIGGLGAGAPAARAATGEITPMRQQATQRSPETWLEEIGRLKRDGREKEAAEQLAEFRKAHPAYAVPEYLLK